MILLVEIITFVGISNIRDINSYIFFILIILNKIISLGKFVYNYNKYKFKSLLDIIKEINKAIITEIISSLSIIKEIILLIPGISYKNTINIFGN
jgi:hypothetical protein